MAKQYKSLNPESTKALIMRLLDLALQDIYTDAPEYRDRVIEIRSLVEDIASRLHAWHVIEQ